MKAAFTIVAVSVALAAPARALCRYNGIDGAQTRVEDELRGSQLVVRAWVESADYHWSGIGPSWTVYRLRVVEAFKGKPPNDLKLFTYRDSGGFYLDSDGTIPDLDNDYVLFLVPVDQGKATPEAARDTFRINYSCGQSKRWSEVSAAARNALDRYANDRGPGPKAPAAGGLSDHQ